MDSGKPEGNEVHVQGGSWIPATPMKPILPKPPLQPLIYARMDRNQPRPHWLGSERLSSGSTNEAEASSGVACYGGANSMGANGSYVWEAASAFLQLMALADAATTVGADAALGGNSSDLFDYGSSSQIGLEFSSMKGRLNGSCIPENLQMKYLIVASMLMTSIFHLGQSQMQLLLESPPSLHLRHQIWARVNIPKWRQKYSSYQLKTSEMRENRTTTVIIQ